METKVKENGAAVNGKAEAAFINNNPVNKEAVKPEEAKAGEVKKDGAQEQPGQPLPPKDGIEQSKPEQLKATEQPNAEPAKAETKLAKPALNLEGTLKLVEELHRRKIQRDKLLDTINTLEAFEVAQIEDGDDTDNNHFQGCTLMIEDDSRRKFITKNPVIIWSVSQYVNILCVEKLSEIEAGIIIPA
ncbi:hypothetical protein [uncultured Mucilaginibacter sp.]|uniref:hypothetical protein n=1 Tax=uncultured Mucilaginibacter sp. TaxID=797541 RepID=UPI002637A0B0|nr:hypothetical protein [uncultured Mucilaginibacter sp.]